MASWKSRLHPNVSRAELQVFEALSKAGLTEGMVTQKPIILRMTVPDFMWSSTQKAVYLDGDVAHQNRTDEDLEIDEMLQMKDWQVLRCSYHAPLSRKRLAEITAEIKEFLEGG